MFNSFNVYLAGKYGIEEAIIIEHLFWWIHKNECEEIEEMIQGGRVWCRSSSVGFNRYIPYMNPKKIRRVLNGLVEQGLLLTGNFNKSPMNQTLWYAFSDDFKKEMKSLNYDFPKMGNGMSKNGKCINIINDNNLNIDNNIIEEKSKKENVPDGTSHTPTEEEKAFVSGMREKFPRIMRMEKPLTFEQAKKLKDKYDRDLLAKVMQDMENWKPLLKKRVSAYQTINTWCQMEEEKT